MIMCPSALYWYIFIEACSVGEKGLTHLSLGSGEYYKGIYIVYAIDL